MKIRKLRMAVAAALISQGSMVQAQTTLEEVVVTAQKRAQSIQEVPISITAFSGEYLEDKGIQKIAGVAQLTPQFQHRWFNTTRRCPYTNTRHWRSRK